MLFWLQKFEGQVFHAWDLNNSQSLMLDFAKNRL